MQILVTGGAGYIGSHTVKMLLEKGYDVVTIDNLSKGHREAVVGGTFIEGDLQDKSFLDKIFSENKIDAVIHFAANSLVGESMVNPGKYFGENLSNGINLLDAMKNHNVNKIIFSSSAAVFGEPAYIPIDEKHPINPTNVYGETKAMFEKILGWYDKIFGIKSIALRYFNVAGADPSGIIGELHDPETHLIPVILRSVMQNKPIKVFGNDYPTKDGTCIRDYIHVNDLAAAHILALEALIAGKDSNVYNLGNGSGFSVFDILNAVEEVICRKVAYEVSERRAGDPSVLVASSEKIIEELRFEYKHASIKEQIRTAWEFYLKNN